MIFKKFMGKTGCKERGMILPLALILLVAATLIVMPGLGFMYSLLTINSNAQQDVAAYYAADSGISAVWWYFNKNFAAPAFPYAVSLNGMTVQVTQLAHTSDSSSDNYTIQSSAVDVGGKTRATVVAKINIPAAGNNIFNEAAAALYGDIQMSGSAKIISDDTSTGNYGNIYANGTNGANGTVTVGYGTSVGGTASATQNVKAGAPTYGYARKTAIGTPLYYTLTENYTASTDPPAPGIMDYTSKASNWTSGAGSPFTVGPGYTTSAVSIASNTVINLTGNLHIKGNLTISGSAVIKGPYSIIIDGNLNISGTASANLVAAPNIPFFIVSGTSVQISGTGTEIAAVIYAPNAAATLSPSTVGTDGYTVYGSVIAKSVTMSGSATIKYLTGIHTETQIPGKGLGGTPVLIGYNYQ